MKKIIFVIAVLASGLVPVHAKDQVMVCEGTVVPGTATFQKINGIIHKIRVEGMIGKCPFTNTNDAGKQISKYCLGDDGPCRVTAIVDNNFWIKKIIKMELSCGNKWHKVSDDFLCEND
jgi:hypothetical protein